MKLASYRDGSRDGQLVVVSRDLRMAHYATGVAHRLQQVLDDWNFLAPQLQELYTALNAGTTRHAFAFDPAQCLAPLPRAYHWCEGQAYPAHSELLQRAGEQAPPEDPPGLLMWQGSGDAFSGASAEFLLSDPELDADIEVQLVAVSGDVAAGVSVEQALEGVRLLTLAGRLCLRRLLRSPAADGGRVPGHPMTVFAPVVVTPDELGPAWQDGRVHLSVQVSSNGRKAGLCETGPDMAFHFGELIAHAAQTRPLGSGSLVASGALAQAERDAAGRLDLPRGWCSIAHRRALEIEQDGAARTAYLQTGDTWRAELKGRDGKPLLGAIELRVRDASGGEAPQEAEAGQAPDEEALS